MHPNQFPQTLQTKFKTVLIRIKNWFLEMLSDLWYWFWEDVSWWHKFLFFFLVVIPAICIPLSSIFDPEANIVTLTIFIIASCYPLIWSIACWWFYFGYICKTPERRRKFYLIMAVILFILAGGIHLFGEDPFLQEKLVPGFSLGGTWFIIIWCLSFWRPVYYD